MNEDAAVAGARDRLARLPLFAGRPLDTLTITPLPEFRSKSWTSTALDLTLDAEIRRWSKIDGVGQSRPINPMLAEFNTDELIARSRFHAFDQVQRQPPRPSLLGGILDVRQDLHQVDGITRDPAW